MIKVCCRSLEHVSRRTIIAIGAVVVSLCFCAPAWTKTKGSYVKPVRVQGQKYNGKVLTQPLRATDVQAKEEIVTARKQGRGGSSQRMEHGGKKRRDYETLSPEEKERLNRKYREWKSLPPEKQELLRRRMKRWDALPPEDRSLYERRFHQWQNLSPEERERIRERLDKWNRLPDEEKEKIRRQFRD